MSDEKYLTTADTIVHGDRNEQYGHPVHDFERIATMWSSFLNINITPKQVAAMMVLLKCSRLAHNIDHEDSWIDIAGYVGCADRIQRVYDGRESSRPPGIEKLSDLPGRLLNLDGAS